MNPGGVALHFASKLVSRDRTCLERLDYDDSMPLHIAAEYGQYSLAKYLIENGAALLTLDKNGLTPLGVAIKQRFITLTQHIMQKHKEQRLAQIAAGHAVFRGQSSIIQFQTSALTFLLTPGRFSSSPSYFFAPAPLSSSRRGCYDYPFSALSLRLLAVLLDKYQDQIWPSGFQPFVFFLHATHNPYTFASGLTWTIRMGNLNVLRMIIDSKRFDPDLRHLIDTAYCQRQLGTDHVATEAEREAVIDYLEDIETVDFEETKGRRVQGHILSFMWRLYYRVYGDIERRQYKRFLAWRFDSDVCRSENPRFLEFRQWYRPRFSFYIPAYISLWVILLPLTICFAVLASASNVAITRSNINHYVFILIFVSLFPHLNNLC